MNQIVFDPVVPNEWLPWLPDREVRLSEYNQMVTSYLRNSQHKGV